MLRQFVILLSLICAGIPHTGISQTMPQEIPGISFNGTPSGGNSNAVFRIGLTLDDGITFTDTARLSENVRIIGTFLPEPEHIGEEADIFVVDRVNLAFTMKNPDGIFIPWNTRVPDLVPFQEDVTLSEELSVDVLTGTLGASGDHRIFLGYMPEDGILRYTPAPLRLDITEEPVVPDAFELFTSNISPNIIGTRCSQCHIPGGLADSGGAQHIFSLPLSSNLQTNFDIFAQLVASRGASYILSKVRGGFLHGGGVQLSASSSLYAEFETFLNQLADAGN